MTKFAVVELAYGIVVDMGDDWCVMSSEVENAEVSRWSNLVLMVVPDDYEPDHEEGEIYRDFGKYLGHRVVAVPQCGWGYGAEYVGQVNRNRKKFGLPGAFVSSEEMEDVIGFRKRLTEMGPGAAIRLMSISDTYLSEPEEREESFDRLQRILKEKEKYER